MSDPSDPSDAPAATPGERRLDRPPSDRYQVTTLDEATSGDTGSAGRAIAAGLVVALVGAAATVVLGGVVGISAGLLVVAAATGWAVGTATVIGGGSRLSRRARPWLAVAGATDAVILGQLGLWLYAMSEGGVLPLVDYLAQTFGVLVPLQAVLSLGLAWWSAR